MAFAFSVLMLLHLQVFVNWTAGSDVDVPHVMIYFGRLGLPQDNINIAQCNQLQALTL